MADESAARLRDARLAMEPTDGGIRRRTRMSQVTLAGLVGVDAGTIRNWERKGLPNAEVMRRLRDVTGVSLDDLYG